MSKNDLIF